MELKVWVEGIQRIVCGVNEKTTCQDVVYALAHATGKTGRFTLIERWRNSERLLAPNEQPLKVLLKWGEHSNDVQFILQWAPLDAGAANKTTTTTNKHFDPQNEHSFGKNLPSLANAGGAAQTNGTSSSSKLKSLAFSSNLGHNLSSSESGSLKRKENATSVGVVRGIPQRVPPEALINSGSSLVDNSSVVNGKVTNANNSGSGSNKIQSGRAILEGDLSGEKKLSKDFNLSSPPPYREPPNPAKALAHSPVNINNTSGGKSLPPYREPPPPNLNNHQQQAGGQMQLQRGGNISATPAAAAGVQNNLPQSVPLLTGGGVSQTSSSHLSHVNNSSGGGVNNHTVNQAIFDSSGASTQPRYNNEPYDIVNFPKEKSENLQQWKLKDRSIANGDISAPTQSESLPKESPSSNSQYQELIRLINLQREKLTAQHAEMTQYDAEILFWEGKAREQKRHLDFITKEIARLELLCAQQDSQVLSLLHLEEENELVKQQSDALKGDMEALRSEFENCEKELNMCRSKMGVLTNDLHCQHLSMQDRQDEWIQREAATLAEIDRLKKELELARRETDAVTGLSGSLDLEVSTLEADLAEKKKQMERLINAMKEANLQSLSIQPPEELIDGGAHHRSGSTRPRRMIGSPRQLENAAPTSKNPHGVWV